KAQEAGRQGPLASSVAPRPHKGYARSMKEVDYSAPAELFSGHGRPGLRYRGVTKSTEAFGYAMGKVPAAAVPATSLEVNDDQYSAAQIRALYDSDPVPVASPLSDQLLPRKSGRKTCPPTSHLRGRQGRIVVESRMGAVAGAWSVAPST